MPSPDHATTSPIERRPKVVLLFPNPISMIPNGFMYVAKRFRANGFDTSVEVNSFTAYRTIDDYYDHVVAQKPDAVGLSYATMNLLDIYRLQRRLQASGYLVIAGGDHPTICPDEVLRNGADVVVRGEGELAIDDLCAWIRDGHPHEHRARLRNASFLEDGVTVHNPSAERLKSLDDLGDLDVAGLDLTPYRTVDGSVKGLNVILSGRGCPFSCTFCSHSAWKRWGSRSVDAMIAEMVCTTTPT